VDIFITVLLFLFAILILFWQSSNLISVYFGSPYVSAKTNLVKKALELAGVKPNENFYELGSGSGQVLIAAQHLGANCTGIEISPIYFFWSRLRTIFNKKIQIKCVNIFDYDLKNADVIYVYLLPNLLEKLAPKFKRELHKGVRIVSIGFEIKGLNLDQKILINKSSIYLYKIN